MNLSIFEDKNRLGWEGSRKGGGSVKLDWWKPNGKLEERNSSRSEQASVSHAPCLVRHYPAYNACLGLGRADGFLYKPVEMSPSLKPWKEENLSHIS
jgi:hypothetical protein